MTNLSFTLIPSTSFSTPTGNYNGTDGDFFSPKFRGAGYYGFTSPLHTVAYFVTDFVGTLVVQATLATEPTDNDWTDLTGTMYSSDVLMSPQDAAITHNFLGKYVWIRIKVTDFQAGIIDKIQFNI